MSMRVLLVYPDGVVETRASIEPATLPSGVITWISLRTSADAAADVLASWGFHRLAVEDVRHAHTRAKFERYPSHDFALIPALDTATPDPLDTAGIYVFVRDGLVVTNAVPNLEAVAVAEQRLIDQPLRGGHAAERVVHALVDAVSDGFEAELVEMERALEPLLEDAPPDVGPAIDAHRDSERIGTLVRARGQFYRLRRTLLPLRETVQRLTDGATREHPECALYFRDVLDHLNYMLEEASLLVEAITGRITTLEARLREASARASAESARANDRLNQVMKYMAAMSTLLLPMTIISGAFGMNFDQIPWSHHPAGFWMATGVMLSSAGGLLVLFRIRKWL